MLYVDEELGELCQGCGMLVAYYRATMVVSALDELLRSDELVERIQGIGENFANLLRIAGGGGE